MQDQRLGSVKVFQILIALSIKERERMGQYVISPYFQVRPQLQELYKLLVHTIDEGEGKETLRSMVYFGLFPEKSGKRKEYLPKMDSHLRKLLADLKVVVDQFLLTEKLASHPSDEDLKLALAYKRLGLDRQFELKVASAIESIPLEQSSSTMLLRRHELETLQYQHFVAQRKWDAIEELPGGALMVHFHVERYKQLCERILVGRVLSRNYPFRLGDARPTVLPVDMLETYPIAKFYALFYELLLNDVGDFGQLRKLTLETCMAIDRDECQQMFNYLQNYCSGQVHRGHSEWQGELLRVYLDRLAFDEELTPQDLMNMVVVAVREKELGSARLLFSSGLKKLRGDHEGLTERYLNCYLLYAEGHYAEARKGVQGLWSADPWFDLSIRTLEVKAWWEDLAEDAEFLLGKINNLVRHLQRESALTASRKQTQIARFKVAARIVRARGNREALMKLEKEVMDNGKLFDQMYLLERIHAYLQEWCVGD